jgi:DHA2 family multidrug resistance protein-like MFS transporter
MSVNGALLRFTYPADRLGRGVGLNALVVSAASAFGPTIASAILALGPWQWLFAVNVPIGVLTFLVGRAALPGSATSGSLDLPSTLLNVATFGLGFVGVDLITRGGNAWLGGAALALAAMAGATLISRSRAQSRPLVPIDLLRNRIFALSIVTSIASFSAQMLAFVSLPFYLQGLLQRTQVDTGLLMTPWPLAAGVAAALAGRLADRFPAPILSSAGLALLAAGLLCLALLPGDLLRRRLAYGDVRPGFRLLSIAEQSRHAVLGADGAERSGERHAGDGAPDRPDDRRDARRHFLSLRLPRRADRAGDSGHVRDRRRRDEPRAPAAHAGGAALQT